MVGTQFKKEIPTRPEKPRPVVADGGVPIPTYVMGFPWSASVVLIIGCDKLGKRLILLTLALVIEEFRGLHNHVTRM